MSARSPKEAIALVLDIGSSASKRLCDDGITFLDMSKKCVERIIERKIFACAGDEIAMILVGTEETANTLNYAHISEGFRMANPSWEMLKRIPEIKGTDVDKSDWIDGLVVAMDVLQTQTEGKKISAKKIVLFVDPDNDVNDDKLDTIISGLQTLEIELTAIGVDLFSENGIDLKEEMDVDNVSDSGENGDMKFENLSGKSRKHRGEALLERIITDCEGISCNFKDAMSQLKNYQVKAVKPTPWNVSLEIGHGIQIPVAAYKKIALVSLPSWRKTVREIPKKLASAPTPESQIEPAADIHVEQERVYMRDDRTVVEKEDRITGYYFGSSAVPFNEYDNEQMRYKSGEKCLSVLGFVRATEVPRSLFIGEGVYYLVPQKKFPSAQQALCSFINGLYTRQKAAIARKVFRKDTSPTLVALFPLQKKKYKCVVMVELPFSEDVSVFVFPRLVPEKDQPGPEELAAVDALLDATDLMNVDSEGEKTEAFRLKDAPNPALAQQFRCLAHRALNPEKPLPPLFEDIKAMVTCPFEGQANYKVALQLVKDVFKIVEQPEMSRSKKEEKRKKKHNNVPDSGSTDHPQPSTSKETTDEITIKHVLVKVGTVKPHEDFTALVTKGEHFRTVCEQMEIVILKLVKNSFGSESFPKALLALKTLRKSCVEKDPMGYNDWLQEFKKILTERDRLKFWELIAKDGLGLISCEENPTSTITQEAARTMLEESDTKAQNDEQDFDDDDDLLNEM